MKVVKTFLKREQRLGNIFKNVYCFFDSDIWQGNPILFKPQPFLITLRFFIISYQFTYYAGVGLYFKFIFLTKFSEQCQNQSAKQQINSQQTTLYQITPRAIPQKSKQKPIGIAWGNIQMQLEQHLIIPHLHSAMS